MSSVSVWCERERVDEEQHEADVTHHLLMQQHAVSQCASEWNHVDARLEQVTSVRKHVIQIHHRTGATALAHTQQLDRVRHCNVDDVTAGVARHADVCHDAHVVQRKHAEGFLFAEELCARLALVEREAPNRCICRTLTHNNTIANLTFISNLQ